MRIFNESYPFIVQTPRELKATGKLFVAGLPDMFEVTVNVTQTNDRSLHVTINGINIGQALMLFNQGTPGQPSPAISFLGKSDDKNWDIELNNIFFQHVESSGTSFLNGSVQRVIARKRRSATHRRTLIGLGDIVIGGFTTISMPTTMSNGSPGFSIQRVIVSLPTLIGDPHNSLYLHMVSLRRGWRSGLMIIRMSNI
ncbi:MAG: hypothetical protein WBC02_06395 [Candidatus Aminicenantaceae bacterium]